MGGVTCTPAPPPLATPLLQKIINNDQSGFLKGHAIAENILLIDGIINVSDNTNKPGLLMFVDFEKAFDSIEWAFVERALVSGPRW